MSSTGEWVNGWFSHPVEYYMTIENQQITSKGNNIDGSQFIHKMSDGA